MGRPEERLETEIKLRLSGADDLATLLGALPGGAAAPSSTQDQTNHFFDTPERALSAALCSLRLREAGEQWTITAKGAGRPADGNAALAIRTEEECGIAPDLAARILSGEASPLVELAEQSNAPGSGLLTQLRQLSAERVLQPLGSFSNHRTRVGPIQLEPDGGLPELFLEFDRTAFPGGRVDWELEVEVPAADAARASELLRSWFRRAGLAWRPASNKFGRFLAILDERA